MKAIGYYLLFIISLTGMSLSDDDTFSEENKIKFLDRIFNLHNMSRNIHKLKLLERNVDMDNISYEIITNEIYENFESIVKTYGLNFYFGEYKNNTQLDDAYADFIFSEWYFERSTNIHRFHPLYIKLGAYKYILWENTEKIGLAVRRFDKYYAVVAIYSPLYETSTQTQVATNVSKPPTFD